MNDSIDFIIVNYNTFDFVKLLIESIDMFVDIPFKIYIIDTSDQSQLFSYYSNREDIVIKRKNFTCNDGSNSAVCNHMGGVNTAFEMGSSKYVCILDPDTIFINKWAKELIPLLEENSFISNRFEPKMNIARPQFMLFKRSFWLDNNLRFENYKDTGGNITLFCQNNNKKFHVLENSYNNKDLVKFHLFSSIYGEQCFINSRPFFIHQGRGGSKGDRSKWMGTFSRFLALKIDIDSLWHYITKNVKNKDESKSTTTQKFKKDVIDFILYDTMLDGDILELGTNRGYTTVILSIVAKMLDKKVYSFENNEDLIKQANQLLSSLGIDNCSVIKKDIYKEDWGLEKKFSFVFIDALHEQKAFQMDLNNAEKILLDGGYIIAHDYGLENEYGRPIYDILYNKEKYQIIKYIGEKEDWNKLGSGKTFDYEGVIIKIRK